MYNYQTRQNDRQNSNSIITIICMIVTFIAIMVAVGQHEQAQMSNYEIKNNCTYHATGTMTGTDGDYVCK